jgi:AraC-like DNA-binding protein
MTKVHDEDRTKARLLWPQSQFASVIFAAIERDTRGVALVAADRYNWFPASPLCSISVFLGGASYLVDQETGAVEKEPLESLVFAGPQRQPIVSWNPGHVHAVTVAVYPEALESLGICDPDRFVDRTVPLTDAVSRAAIPRFEALLATGSADRLMADFQRALCPLCTSKNASAARTFSRLEDWTRSVVMRAAFSAPGRSLRQIQRRIRGMTGLSRRELWLFARNEKLYERVLRSKEVDLAGIATEHGYSDQSHMGREVRRITGHPPARLLSLIETAEPFWCYRLLGERF